MISINCRGRLLNLDKPAIMGVINLTPDSFYAGSRFHDYKELDVYVGEMIEHGADIIDIGGMSSRPGAKEVSVEEEISRISNPIQRIRKLFPDIFISLDTVKSEVAKVGVEEGIDIINDISGANMDERLIEIVANAKVPYILMHMQGIPQSMQESPNYENVVLEILGYLKNKLSKLNSAGIKEVIVDPGFGFGKSLKHNYQILRNLEVFSILERPILIGLSRKRMIQEVISGTAEEALNGTTAAHMLALRNGANIVRVHDVKEAAEAIKIWTYYKEEG